MRDNLIRSIKQQRLLGSRGTLSDTTRLTRRVLSITLFIASACALSGCSVARGWGMQSLAKEPGFNPPGARLCRSNFDACLREYPIGLDEREPPTIWFWFESSCPRSEIESWHNAKIPESGWKLISSIPCASDSSILYDRYERQRTTSLGSFRFVSSREELRCTTSNQDGGIVGTAIDIHRTTVLDAPSQFILGAYSNLERLVFSPVPDEGVAQMVYPLYSGLHSVEDLLRAIL